MMLLLFSYPLRKYVRFMHRLGKVKWWFLVHMVLGIGGPLLILVHSTFRIGSLNAGGGAVQHAASWSRSGVVGRFIYVRVHRGLYGEQTILQRAAGARRARSRARRARGCTSRPRSRRACWRLRAARAAAPSPAGCTWLRQVFVLPVQQWLVYWRCVAELRQPAAQDRRQRGWSASDLRARAAPARASWCGATSTRGARRAVHRLRAPVRAVARGAPALRLPAGDQRGRARDRGARVLTERLD